MHPKSPQFLKQKPKSQSQSKNQLNVLPPKNKKTHFQQIVDNLEVILSSINSQKRVMYLCGYCSSMMQLKFTNVNILQKIITNLSDAISQSFINSQNFLQILLQSSYLMKNQKILDPQKYMQQFEIHMNQLIYQITCNKQYLKQTWQMRQFGLSNKKQNQNFIDLQSLKLIQKIQQQDKKQKQQLQNKTIECPVCLQQVKYIDMGTLSCGHIFHKMCISLHIIQHLNNKKISIPCPTGCPKNLLREDIEEFTQEKFRQKYSQFCLDAYIEKGDSGISWCPTANCTAIFSYDKSINTYRCPVCKKGYCLSCRCEQHHKMTCAQYRVNKKYSQQDKKFHEFVKGAKFKQCPKCKFWVERSQGCSSMMCRCGSQFCYDCGGVTCPHGSCSNKK